MKLQTKGKERTVKARECTKCKTWFTDGMSDFSWCRKCRKGYAEERGNICDLCEKRPKGDQWYWNKEHGRICITCQRLPEYKKVNKKERLTRVCVSCNRDTKQLNNELKNGAHWYMKPPGWLCGGCASHYKIHRSLPATDAPRRSDGRLLGRVSQADKVAVCLSCGGPAIANRNRRVCPDGWRCEACFNYLQRRRHERSIDVAHRHLPQEARELCLSNRDNLIRLIGAGVSPFFVLFKGRSSNGEGEEEERTASLFETATSVSIDDIQALMNDCDVSESEEDVDSDVAEDGDEGDDGDDGEDDWADRIDPALLQA